MSAISEQLNTASHSPSRYAPFNPSRADRDVGWLICIGGSILSLGSIPNAIAQVDYFSLWWTTIALLATTCLFFLAFFGRHLAGRVLGALWILLPLVNVLLLLTSFGASTNIFPVTEKPWLWELEPAFLSLLVVLVSPWRSIPLAILSSLAPAASALLFTSQLPNAIFEATPIHLGNLVFIGLFIGIRAQLQQLYRSESAARYETNLRAIAVANAQYQGKLARLVHDEVLAVLNATLYFSGSPPKELGRAAQHATEVLDFALAQSFSADRPLPTSDAATILSSRLGGIGGKAKISVSCGTGIVGSVAVEAIAAASAEAIRNAQRHAPESAHSIQISIADRFIQVTVTDQGPGFDWTEMDPTRLGVTNSITGRMAQLPGGRAEITSVVGQGTTVEVTWLNT